MPYKEEEEYIYFTILEVQGHCPNINLALLSVLPTF